MKFLVAVVAYVLITLSISVPASAQDGFRFSSVSIGSGESPVSNGLSGTLILENEKNRVIDITLQEEQAWVKYGLKFKTGRLEGNLSGAAGHFQGAPWVSPYLDLKFRLTEVAGQKVTVGTLQWPAFFIGREPNNWKNDGIQNPEEVLVGYLSGFNMNIGPLGLDYSFLDFLDEPLNSLPGINFTQKIRKDLAVTASGTYNKSAKKPMFFIGATWTPEKK